MLYFFTKVQIHVVAEIAHKMWINFMLQNLVTLKMIPGLRSMQTVFLYIFVCALELVLVLLVSGFILGLVLFCVILSQHLGLNLHTCF